MLITIREVSNHYELAVCCPWTTDNVVSAVKEDKPLRIHCKSVNTVVQALRCRWFWMNYGVNLWQHDTAGNEMHLELDTVFFVHSCRAELQSVADACAETLQTILTSWHTPYSTKVVSPPHTQQFTSCPCSSTMDLRKGLIYLISYLHTFLQPDQHGNTRKL